MSASSLSTCLTSAVVVPMDTLIVQQHNSPASAKKNGAVTPPGRKTPTGRENAVHIPDDLEFPTSSFVIPRCYESDLASVIIPEGMIRDRVKRVSQEIHETVGDQQLALLCVLKGSYRFFTTLVDELSIARAGCEAPMTCDFIRVKSYEDSQRTERLQIIGLSNMTELKDANVLIVDDIVDSGVTMARLINTLKDAGVRRYWTALLLSKRVQRERDVHVDFAAFSIPDKFIVGYGLDYNQKFRDLNHICRMSHSGIEHYKTKQ